ncbi:MAG TPA: VOC family protein [Euzebyales bacterium]|nr:VOC family protein [Euzebyales bacterium]
MGTRLQHVVIACNDHVAQARWWAEALGWSVVHTDDREAAVEPAGGPEADIALVFVPVLEPKVGKNRIHLDLASATAADQDAIVERLVARGAQHADIGQTDVSWVVLTDPEGNECCVLAPDSRFDEPGTLAAIVVDAVAPGRLARFWAEASGWQIRAESHLVATLCHPDGRPPALDIVAVPDPTPGKNRVHLDVAPLVDDNQDAEVARLRALGAQPADVGQADDVTWVVLVDPEGNEFCVLSPRR